jgi:hypothetical protein
MAGAAAIVLRRRQQEAVPCGHGPQVLLLLLPHDVDLSVSVAVSEESRQYVMRAVIQSSWSQALARMLGALPSEALFCLWDVVEQIGLVGHDTILL